VEGRRRSREARVENYASGTLERRERGETYMSQSFLERNRTRKKERTRQVSLSLFLSLFLSFNPSTRLSSELTPKSVALSNTFFSVSKSSPNVGTG